MRRMIGNVLDDSRSDRQLAVEREEVGDVALQTAKQITATISTLHL